MGTTMQLFRTLRIPKSKCVDNMVAAYTHVPHIYKVMFHGYNVREWTGFNENAARALVGDDNQNIPAPQWTYLQSIPVGWESRSKPASEGGLLNGFSHNIIGPLSVLRRGRRSEWSVSQGQSVSSVDTNGKNRKPDFVLSEEIRTDRGGSSSSKTTNAGQEWEAIVIGEVKAPRSYLGSNLSTTTVNNILHHEDYMTNGNAKAFFQVFSYMLRTRKGVGILTNYDHIRFFKINAGAKEVYMSPLVRVEQLLSRSEGTPHTLQTFLYAESMQDQFESKEVKKILQVQLHEARKGAEEKERKRAEQAVKEAAKKGGASSSSDQGKSKSSSKSGGKHGKHGVGSGWTVSPVTLVMDKCKVIGTLGFGICGFVEECDYEGVKVALKVGFPFDPDKDEEDCFAIVENEIKMYELLEELQGRVIPRMIAGGFENIYCPESMVLITERVGLPITEIGDEVFIGEKEITRKDVVLIREKGLEGLKAIHEHGVVHYDAELRNIRVEMKDGKVDKVWWIDFGQSSNTYWDVLVEGDNEVYKRDVDRILEKVESQY